MFQHGDNGLLDGLSDLISCVLLTDFVMFMNFQGLLLQLKNI